MPKNETKKILKRVRNLQKNENNLPENIKNASAKILTKYGYTVREIAKVVGMSRSAVGRIKAKDENDIAKIDPESWDIASQAIRKVLVMKRDQLSAKVLQKIEGKLNEDKAPLGTLAFLYKVLRESDQPKEQKANTINNIQVRVIRETHSMPNANNDTLEGTIVTE